MTTLEDVLNAFMDWKDLEEINRRKRAAGFPEIEEVPRFKEFFEETVKKYDECHPAQENKS